MNTPPVAGAVRKLVLERPGHEPQEFLVAPGPLRAGRVKACDIVIAGDTAVSREHCRFEYDPAAHVLRVRDLDSSNGTYVNDQRAGAEPVRLMPGDRIHVGSAVLGYVVVPATAGPPSPPLTAGHRTRPWPPRKGEAERTVFGPDYCVCGRCQKRFATGKLGPGDKAGCVNCRAVWRVPAVKEF